MTTIRCCSWCHAGVVIVDGKPTLCHRCGHRGDVARVDCDCRQCVVVSVVGTLATVATCIVVISALSYWQTYRECRSFHNLSRGFCATVLFR